MNRYSNIKETKSPSGKQIYKTVYYPEIPRLISDIYVYTTAGDRYDTLALQFYDNSSLWWVIANANDGFNQNSLIPPLGVQIRIPLNPTLTLDEFEEINN
tara:strand:- start:62 stop:361 length:300 start_codon:yes stop_codon:yes gene_type:complete